MVFPAKNRPQQTRRNAKKLSFEEMWNRGPIDYMRGGNVSPKTANGMKWLWFITCLTRARPIPQHVRQNPHFLAEPLSRETGWRLDACLHLVKDMLKGSARQLKAELHDPQD